MDSSTDFSGNIERFSGFAEVYDRYRPSPPAILADILIRLAGTPFPHQVVDLGSGTGLSTRYWADRSQQVIGVEPTADMRRQAEAQTAAPNVSFREGFSHETGLSDRCADIVTCSQALHWMEPQATFEEVRRITRPGGVFAAYDYDWPPATGEWKADAAFTECMSRVKAYEKERALDTSVKRWDKHQHLTRMQASGCFRYTREIVVHHLDHGNAGRLFGILLSQGSVMTLLKQGLREEQLGIDRFKEIVERTLESEEQIWYWSSRVRIGIV
jgi:ubiquinone/menaquinone biosynthesis C-methylase UbiE